MLIFPFLACIVLANVAVEYLNPVPVGFGLVAPAGVYFVALTLVLRDLVQRFHGARGVLLAATLGMGLSVLFGASEVALASSLAYLASMAVDTLIFTAVYHWWRRSLPTAVLVSGLISLVPDTLIFLAMIDGLQFVPGQLLGKTIGTLSAWFMVWAINRALPDKREAVPSE